MKKLAFLAIALMFVLCVIGSAGKPAVASATPAAQQTMQVPRDVRLQLRLDAVAIKPDSELLRLSSTSLGFKELKMAKNSGSCAFAIGCEDCLSEATAVYMNFYRLGLFVGATEEEARAGARGEGNAYLDEHCPNCPYYFAN